MIETDRGNSGVRPWLRDSGSLFGFQLVATAIGTVTFLLIARSLGRDDFGAFAATLAVAQSASFFLDAGLGTYLLREFSLMQRTQRHLDTNLIATVLWIEVRLIAIALPCVALVVFSLTAVMSLAVLAGVLIGYVGLLALATSIESYSRAQRRVERVGTALLIEKLSGLIGMTAIVAAGRHGELLVGTVLLFSAAARLVFDVITLPRAVTFRFSGFSSIGNDVQLLTRTLPFAATSVVLVALPQLAVTAVAIVSTTAAAYFAVGERLVNSVVVYCTSLSQTLYPHIAKGALHARRAFAIQFGAGAVGCAAIVILASPILKIAFGTVEPISVRTVRIMALSIPFTFLASGFLVQAYSRGLERRTSVFSLAATMIGMVAIVVGVVAWGSTGAALGYVLRQILFSASLGLLLYRASGTADARLVIEQTRPG